MGQSEGVGVPYEGDGSDRVEARQVREYHEGDEDVHWNWKEGKRPGVKDGDCRVRQPRLQGLTGLRGRDTDVGTRTGVWVWVLPQTSDHSGCRLVSLGRR